MGGSGRASGALGARSPVALPSGLITTWFRRELPVGYEPFCRTLRRSSGTRWSRPKRLHAGCASIFRMRLKLAVLEGTPLSGHWTRMPFPPNPGFNEGWWLGDVRGPLVFYSFRVREEISWA